MSELHITKYKKLAEVDINELTDVYFASFVEDHNRLTLWTREQLTEPLTNGDIWGALQNDVLVGFLIVSPLQDEILSVGVHPSSRKQGIAERLITTWLQLVSPQAPIHLEVHEHSSAAQKLYAKLGFIECGRRTNYYPDGGSAILMRLGSNLKL